VLRKPTLIGVNAVDNDIARRTCFQEIARRFASANRARKAMHSADVMLYHSLSGPWRTLTRLFRWKLDRRHVPHLVYFKMSKERRLIVNYLPDDMEEPALRVRTCACLSCSACRRAMLKRICAFAVALTLSTATGAVCAIW
jgi:hypothetical protein